MSGISESACTAGFSPLNQHPVAHARVLSLRWALVGLMSLLMILAVPFQAHANPNYAAIVVDSATGRVLHASNADAARYPASLTKMMTLYLLFEAMEQGKLNAKTQMRVSAHAAAQSPSKLGLAAGSTISVDDAIRALVVKSANDVAVVVAEAVGGTESGFAARMTSKARALGMSRTTFMNASGLPNLRQVTSARDLAVLGMALQRHFPKQYSYFSIRSFRYRGVTIPTHNYVLREYRGADGLKTGYINASGFNVVSSARRGNNRVLAVVMGGTTRVARDSRMKQLLDQGFSELDRQKRTGNKSGAVVAVGGSAPAKSAQVASAATPTPAPTKPARSSGNTQMAMRSGADSSLDVETEASFSTVSPPSATGSSARRSAANASWGVQVGAYAQQSKARGAAGDAQTILERKFKSGLEPVAITFRSNGSTLYRARVMGIDSRKSATQACAVLQRSNWTCLVVTPAGENHFIR